jgi:uncharacterized protein involved in exopolysaccharide biosynthesis
MEQKVNMLDGLRVLVVNRKFIALCTVGAILVSVVIALVLPKWYKARASVMPPESASSSLDLVGMMSYVGFQPALLPTMTSPSEVYAAILGSVRVKQTVIDSLDLASVYREETPEKLLKKLNKHTWISVSSEGLIVVECEDKQPERARRMVNLFVRELDRFNRFSQVTSARAVRQFIENRIAEVTDELSRAEKDLKAFKDSTGAILLTEQARVSIETAAVMYAEIAQLEVARERVRGLATERSPEVIDLDRQIMALEQKLAEMGYTHTRSPGAGESMLFPSFAKAPALEMELARLMRDVEVKRAVYAVLSEQYEQAKIQEMKNTPTVQVLDWGRTPTIRWRPKRKTIVGISTLSALILSCVIVMLSEAARRGKYRSEKDALSEIGRTLSSDVDSLKRMLKGE